MRGWIITKSETDVENMTHILGTTFYYQYKHNGKFVDDKICIDKREVFFLLDGVVFNKAELMKGNSGLNWTETFIENYMSHGTKWIKRLRGSFNGFVLDKRQDKVVAFVDQLGERPVFYNENQDKYLIGSDFNCVIDILRDKGERVSVDKYAVKNMLYFGYMVDNRTYVEEIKRVFPGNCVVYDGTEIREQQYFRFSNSKQIEVSEAKAIELIDEAFTLALRREFDKDLEYGYESLVDISGGLDARTVCFAAKRLGYTNITNLCYSQINAYEKKITENLVERLGNDYIFKSLNNASFIFNVDEIVKENYGLGYFAGITGGRDFLRALNPNQFGIEHTGLLGDVYEGSFNEKAVYEKPFLNPRYRFSKLLNIDIDKQFLEAYDDNEIFGFYTRGVLGGASTHIIRQKYFETYSPFEDVDFLNLMFSLPLKQRIDGKIYLKWVTKKYPEALDVIYAKTMCKVDAPVWQLKLRALYNVLNIKFVLPFAKWIKLPIETNYRATMNPFDYWYETNPKLRSFIKEYYKSTIHKVDSDIRGYLDKIMEEGNAIDKMVMLTILSVYKQYF